jgi:hypothetical protein
MTCRRIRISLLMLRKHTKRIILHPPNLSPQQRQPFPYLRHLAHNPNITVYRQRSQIRNIQIPTHTPILEHTGCPHGHDGYRSQDIDYGCCAPTVQVVHCVGHGRCNEHSERSACWRAACGGFESDFGGLIYRPSLVRKLAMNIQEIGV